MTALLTEPPATNAALTLDLDALIAANVEAINGDIARRRTPTRFAIYARISSDPDGTEEGVDEQEADLRHYIERFYPDAVIVRGAVYKDDDRSAFKENVRRDGFEDMLRDADLGIFDAVAVRDSDRLYRRLDELPRITKELVPHAQVVAMMEGEVDLTTAAGILRAQMLGAVAEHESRRKAERVAANARHRAQGGTMTASNRPYGWAWKQPCDAGDDCEHRKPHAPDARPRVGSRAGLVPHPVEGQYVADAYENVADKGWSLRQVARWLSEEGQTGTLGVPFTEGLHIRKILLSPRNAGLVAHGDKVVAKEKDGQALVSVDLWQRVKLHLEDPTRRTSPGRPANSALSGIARCGLCGGPMNASKGHSRSRRTGEKNPPVPIYTCGRKLEIRKRQALVDDYVLGYLGKFLAEGADRLREAASDDTVGAAEMLARQEIARLGEQIDSYKRLGTEFDPADLAEILRDLRTKKADAEARAAKVSRRPSVGALLAEEDIEAAWAALVEADDKEPLRNVIRDVVETIEVHRRPRKGYTPIDEQVTIKLQEWARAEG